MRNTWCVECVWEKAAAVRVVPVRGRARCAGHGTRASPGADRSAGPGRTHPPDPGCPARNRAAGPGRGQQAIPCPAVAPAAPQEAQRPGSARGGHSGNRPPGRKGRYGLRRIVYCQCSRYSPIAEDFEQGIEPVIERAEPQHLTLLEKWRSERGAAWKRAVSGIVTDPDTARFHADTLAVYLHTCWPCRRTAALC